MFRDMRITYWLEKAEAELRGGHGPSGRIWKGDGDVAAPTPQTLILFEYV